MNWLTREMLGLRRKDKLGAPIYYQLSDAQKDALAYSLGIGSLLGADYYEKQNRQKSEQEREARRKIDAESAEAKRLNKGDTSFRPEPASKPEPATPAKPVEKTPAKPKPQPSQPKVNPSDVVPRQEQN